MASLQPIPSCPPTTPTRASITAAAATEEKRAVTVAAKPVFANMNTEVRTPRREVHRAKIVTLDDAIVLKKVGDVLAFTFPGCSNVFEGNMRTTQVSPWLSYIPNRIVWAPDPSNNHAFCLGRMVSTNPHIEFEPMDTSDDLISHVNIEFSDKSAYYFSGNPPAAIHRGHIWPA
jgi:hypothetical protein